MSAELVSEVITPLAGTFDASQMAQGVPGLPAGFRWRGTTLHIVRELESWKESSREGGGAGDLYLRRHCHRLLMDNGSTWTIYFTRQTPKSGSAKKRWFLYTVDRPKESKEC